MSETVENRAEWIRRMLGMAIPLDGMGPLAVSPPQDDIDLPSQVIQKKPKRGKIKKVEAPNTVSYDTVGITIRHAGKGKPIQYTAPPPPISDLNFAGGGGKGTALFGAVEALQNGTMDRVKRVNGASVGAITSALLASGITLDELQPIVDSEGDKSNTTSLITDGTMGSYKKLLGNAIMNRGAPMTGEGTREVVALNMDESIRKRVQEYQTQYERDNGTRDRVVDTILQRIDAKLGPTFQDMRDLSQIIPTIKDISVTGSYTKEVELSQLVGKPERDKTKQVKSKDKNDQGQLFIFSADTVPDMPVALAVQASAAFPFAFAPVDINLSDYMRDVKDPQSGQDMKDRNAKAWKVRFVDGGVTNNMPTQGSIGNERPLDPIPQERSLNFVFQGSSSANAISKPRPELPRPGGFGDRMKDKAVSSKNWAAEYGLSVDAQEHAMDFVVVPLQFSWKKKDGEVVEVDMSGMENGTLNFNPDRDQVQEIRKRTKEETENQLQESEAPQTHSFASDTQMLMAIGMNELKALKDAKPPYRLAKSAWTMRTEVARQIGQAKTKRWPENPDDRKREIGTFLGDMDGLAKGNKDQAAYIAREIHKAGIDYVIDNAEGAGVAQTSVGKAVGMISEAKKVFNVTGRVLKNLVYPKMRDERKTGVSIGLLERVSGELRKAVSWDEVKTQFQLLIAHYKGKSDKKRFLPLPGVKDHGHKAFYKQMKREFANVEKVSAHA